VYRLVEALVAGSKFTNAGIYSHVGVSFQ
jgi:hypothetical protein